MNSGTEASAADRPEAVNAAQTASSRVFGRALLVASAGVGAACATATVLLSGPLSALDATPGWPLSAFIVGTAAAIWFAGFVLALTHAAWRKRPSRPAGWLMAFGLAPFAAALFFFLVSISVTGGSARGYLTAAAVLVLAVICRRQLTVMAEKLLLAFFAWLGLLVLPAVCGDPVNRLFSHVLLALLRKGGVVV